MPFYEQAYTAEQRALADHLIGLEKAALDKWFRGDTSGYRQLWSERSFTYIDGVIEHRVNDYGSVMVFLDGIEGKLYAEHYDFCVPRVQFGADMAVLTYELYADTNLINMRYNCVEVFQKEGNEWRVIHSTWSFIRPMDMDFGKVKNVV